MSKVSDLEIVNSDILRNGALQDVAEPPLGSGIRGASTTKESERAKSPPSANGLDIEIQVKFATSSECDAENGKDVSAVNSSCSSTATEDRLHCLIDSLPIAKALQDLAASDEMVEDPMDVTHRTKHCGELPLMPNDRPKMGDFSAIVDSSASLPQVPNATSHQIGSPKKRVYISRTLQQLEDATKNWFTRDSHTGTDPNPPRPKDAIDLFSLKYNETSVSTIAAWVAGGSTRKRSTTKFHRPIVDTRFRSCSFCGRYGHYEVECQSLTPEQMLKLSRIISGEASVTNEYSTMNIKHHDYDVVIEICDGFFIEQQSDDHYKIEIENKDREKILNLVEKPIRERQSVAKDKTKNEMIIDGFLICEEPAVESSSNPETSFLQIPAPERAPIQEGSLVTWIWKESTDGKRLVPEVILVGTVAKIDAAAGRVLVDVLRVICSESKSAENFRVGTENCISLGARVSVCASSLYLVDEQNQVMQINQRLPKNSRRSEKTVVIKRSRTKKSENILVKHGRTEQPKSNSDGLSINAKRARKPNGLVWDDELGVWVLPSL